MILKLKEISQSSLISIMEFMTTLELELICKEANIESVLIERTELISAIITNQSRLSSINVELKIRTLKDEVDQSEICEFCENTIIQKDCLEPSINWKKGLCEKAYKHFSEKKVK